MTILSRIFLYQNLSFIFIKFDALDDHVGHLRKIKRFKLFRLVNSDKNESRLHHQDKHCRKIKDVDENLDC